MGYLDIIDIKGSPQFISAVRFGMPVNPALEKIPFRNTGYFSLTVTARIVEAGAGRKHGLIGPRSVASGGRRSRSSGVRHKLGARFLDSGAVGLDFLGAMG